MYWVVTGALVMYSVVAGVTVYEGRYCSVDTNLDEGWETICSVMTGAILVTL